MATEALYYFDKCCSKHPDIDAAFTDVLSDNLKSDSLEPRVKDSNKVVSSSKVKEEFPKAIRRLTRKQGLLIQTQPPNGQK
jgi:hypothetical protein